MKTFLKIFAGIVLVVVVGLSGCYLGRNKLIKSAVETFVPKMTQTAVSLEQVDFNPFNGYVSVKNLKIGNPQGFSANDMLSLGEITVSMVPKSLMTNKIVINDILIDNVSATYEMSLNGTSNIAVIQKNVSGDVKKTPAAEKKKTDISPEKQVVIKQFTLKNAKVAADFAGAKIVLPLPDIKLTGLGENKPSTASEIFALIINVFSKETLITVTKSANEAFKSGAKSVGRFIDALF